MSTACRPTLLLDVHRLIKSSHYSTVAAEKFIGITRRNKFNWRFLFIRNVKRVQSKRSCQHNDGVQTDALVSLVCTVIMLTLQKC
jgi:hypothetical protein